MDFDKIYILDTSIILEEAAQITIIGEGGKNLIVIPETVIDEIDQKKGGFDEINFQAREFGRLLEEAVVIKTIQDARRSNITEIKIGEVVVHIISLEKYDVEGYDRSVVNDRKIINVAKFAISYYNKPDSTIFLSNDIMCRTRAISLNVNSQSLNKKKGLEPISFLKVIEGMNSNEFNTLESSNINDYNIDHKPWDFCYHFKSSDGHERIAYIVNNKIKLITDDLFNGVLVKPLNLGQKFSMIGMLDPDIDVCLIEALAGTGKTLLAVAAGMKKVQQGTYDKIIYIRNSVESIDKAEEVGFLSGNDEKFKIYNYPLYDSLEFIAQKKVGKDSKINSLEERVNSLVDKYHISTMWIGEMRGRSISNAFVIIDEIQNFSKSSLRTALTRIDKDCKVVCVGSNRQIDHPYINKYTNGLSVLMDSLKEENKEINIFGSEMHKVVRGKITAFAERIFDGK